METNNLDEQELCISCGFCCDKTLFEVASIPKGEEIADHFEKQEIELKGDRYFKLPCPHFDEKCTIYDKQKPKICSAFKCRLLKSMINEKIEKQDALKVISEVKKARQEIIDGYEELIGEVLPFRDILAQVVQNSDFENDPIKKRLKFKVHLLDIQLAQEFKSRKEFDQLYAMID